ncbi:MAG: ATP-NAD kinase family protein [Candidatus Hodarchaeales archaeon]|jgi:predicted polyphosphate/ATP-dependent NAD kinase
MKTIGFIINPIAGMGGKVGLKGTDSNKTLIEAKKRGAKPIAGERTKRFLSELIRYPELLEISFIVPQGDMGANIFKMDEFSTSPLSWRSIQEIPIPQQTTKQHTFEVAEFLKELEIDLLIFVGGDGTAHDILKSVGEDFPLLGIPSGVKMHSGVFAQEIEKATQIIRKFVRGEIQFVKTEVIDLDEEEFRQNRIVTKLYGFCLVPQVPLLMQSTKSSSYYLDTEKKNLKGIIRFFTESIDSKVIYLLGPGSTIKELAISFGPDVFKQKTLLGIDAVQDYSIIGQDLSESEIWYLLSKEKVKTTRIIITPIGGQGFILGRGNQPFSPRIIRKVGIKQIDVVSTRSKIDNLVNRALHVDTGDLNLDRQFLGFIKVLIDYNVYSMVLIS